MYRLLLIAMLGLCGCQRVPCPTLETKDVWLDTPEHTIDTFVRAFACDDAVVEYACFSDSVKRSFNTFAGYKLGRAMFREENRLQVLALRWADLSEYLTVSLRPDGRSAIARITIEDQPELSVLLVNEPRYFMLFADGQRVEGYATHSQVDFLSDDDVLLVLHDPEIEKPREQPVLLEVESRWVIRDLGGLVARAAEPPLPSTSVESEIGGSEDVTLSHDGSADPSNQGQDTPTPEETADPTDEPAEADAAPSENHEAENNDGSP